MKKYIFGVYAALLIGNAISADFTGSWGYVKNIPGGVYGKYFNIKQSPKYIITGEWYEGRSDGPGGSGKVKGYVKKGGKLYLSYCSEGDNSWYTPCPKYEQDRGYFVRWNGDLVEYYRPYGKGQVYKKGEIFKRQQESKQIEGQEQPQERQFLDQQKLLKEQESLRKQELLKEQELLRQQELLKEQESLRRQELLKEQELLRRQELLKEQESLRQQELLKEQESLRKQELLLQRKSGGEPELLNVQEIFKEQGGQDVFKEQETAESQWTVEKQELPQGQKNTE